MDFCVTKGWEGEGGRGSNQTKGYSRYQVYAPFSTGKKWYLGKLRECEEKKNYRKTVSQFIFPHFFCFIWNILILMISQLQLCSQFSEFRNGTLLNFKIGLRVAIIAILIKHKP